MLKLITIFFASSCIVLSACFSLFAGTVDQETVKAEFDKTDTNKDGVISPDEMNAYQKERFEQLDADKDASIDQEELKNDKTLMFQKADQNNDGEISASESASQFNEYFKQMDKDKDNKVTLQEYTDYWKGILYF